MLVAALKFFYWKYIHNKQWHFKETQIQDVVFFLMWQYLEGYIGEEMVRSYSRYIRKYLYSSEKETLIFKKDSDNNDEEVRKNWKVFRRINWYLNWLHDGESGVKGMYSWVSHLSDCTHCTVSTWRQIKGRLMWKDVKGIWVGCLYCSLHFVKTWPFLH